MTKKSELSIITETKRLIEYIFLITEKSPKKYRYSFITKIHGLLIEIIELLYEANSVELGNVERLNKQEKIKVKFMILDYICDIAQKEKCILFNQYENITKYINLCMKLLNSWILSDKKRLN